jgi:hypothetical protein
MIRYQNSITCRLQENLYRILFNYNTYKQSLEKPLFFYDQNKKQLIPIHPDQIIGTTGESSEMSRRDDRHHDERDYEDRHVHDSRDDRSRDHRDSYREREYCNRKRYRDDKQWERNQRFKQEPVKASETINTDDTNKGVPIPVVTGEIPPATESESKPDDRPNTEKQEEGVSNNSLQTNTTDNSICFYVGMLPFDVQEKTVRDLFLEQGEITKCIMVCKRGNFKGYAFVTINTKKTAKEVISALDGNPVGKRRIRVNLATDTKPHEERK